MFAKSVMTEDESYGMCEWTAHYGSMKSKIEFQAAVLVWRLYCVHASSAVETSGNI